MTYVWVRLLPACSVLFGHVFPMFSHPEQVGLGLFWRGHDWRYRRWTFCAVAGSTFYLELDALFYSAVATLKGLRSRRGLLLRIKCQPKPADYVLPGVSEMAHFIGGGFACLGRY